MEELKSYSIIKEISKGGFSKLYIATTPEHERVVIRTLDPNDPHYRQRRRLFKHSIRVMEALDHEYIVKLFEHGCHKGRPYMVLEFIDGTNLRDLILQRADTLDTYALRIMYQLAEALNFSHYRGWIHMDVKPENIMFSSETEHCTLLDFDLAVRAGQSSHVATLKGTPAYMAPELFAGTPVTERCDIFSFGVAFYELLTGHKPFEQENPEKSKLAQISPDVKPTPLQHYRKDVPRSLQQVVSKCLAKDIEYRYPSMSLIIRDLRQII